TMLASLRGECDEQTKRIDEGEENIQRLRREIGLAMGQSTIANSTVNPFRETIAQADAQVIDAQIRVDSLERLRNDPVAAMQATGDSVGQNLAMKLTDAQAELASMQHRYGDNHPRVQAARENVIFLASAANEHIDRTIEKIQSDSEIAKAQANRIREQLENNHSELAVANGKYAMLLAALERQEVQKNLQKILSERAEKMSVDLQLPTPAAEMIEPASAPANAELMPSQILFSALAIGLAVGTLCAVSVDRFDHTIREADELASQINLPILGTIGKNVSMLRPADGGKDVEAYRMIRNAIDFADHTNRSICVTSAAMNEGVSTTVANLAWTWAEQGARVIVIDADLRNPTTHAMFGVPNDTGLIDYLATRQPLNELVKSTTMQNIWVLPSGAGDRKMFAAPPLTPQHMDELLTWAKSQADIVLFDTGAALATSDTAIVAHHCDVSILVTRQSQVTTKDLRRCVHILNTSGTKLLGAVLTGSTNATWDPQQFVDSPMKLDQAVEQSMPTSIRKKDAA
ncbi:MAG TPA: polysaccharide biosynthesis tyrosine autokinase, partial [Tepidisphaeraceae bacterium]|nr:polysaccharide biosynthesis tyrosine autokinase [Tepidisphaeraceae bacterium]